MKPRFSIPPIPEAERTPLVTVLLGLIEGLAERVQKQEEEIAHLSTANFSDGRMDEGGHVR